MPGFIGSTKCPRGIRRSTSSSRRTPGRSPEQDEATKRAFDICIALLMLIPASCDDAIRGACDLAYRWRTGALPARANWPGRRVFPLPEGQDDAAGRRPAARGPAGDVANGAGRVGSDAEAAQRPAGARVGWNPAQDEQFRRAAAGLECAHRRDEHRRAAPGRREEAAQYSESPLALLSVRPGITGLWQVSGRSDTSYANRVRLDLQYIRQWNVWLDVSILFRTLPNVLVGRGAC